MNKNNLKVHHPFDSLFKAAMKRKEVVTDFLQNRLSPELLAKIDLKTLKLENSSFLTKKLLKRESDVIYSVNIDQLKSYIFFLIEEQTEEDDDMPMRIIEYNTLIQRQSVNNDDTPNKRIPAVINIVVYTGEEPYKGAKTLKDAFQQPHMVNAMFDHVFLIDLQKNSKNQIEADKKAALMEFLLVEKRRKDFCKLLEERPDIVLLLNDCGYKVEATIYMLAREKHDPNKLLEKFDTLNKETKDEIMSALEKLRQEGRREGKREGEKSIVAKMISKGLLSKTQAEQLLKEK